MIRVLPAGRSAISRLVLVVLLLGSALCVLGAVTLDLARAASASVRDGGAAGPAGDRTRAVAAPSSSSRGTADSGPQHVRFLLRAAAATAAAVPVPEPETGSAGAAPPLPRSTGSTALERPRDGHRSGSVEGVSDRAPPVTAGT